MPLRHWIASFSDLAGLAIIQEPRGNRIGRVRRELRRGGLLGFADVLAFRAYYSLRLSRADRNWVEDARARLARGLPVVPCSIPRFVTDDPNNRVTRRFIDAKSPTDDCSVPGPPRK